MSAGVEEANALVGVDKGRGRYTPNTRATVLELYDGLKAESQNRWPSLRRDIGAINDLLAPLIPAGFSTRPSNGRPRSGTRSTSRSFAEPQASAGRRRSPMRTATPAASRIATC
jgi:sarcosine oxidase subunit alpha